jgi:uncharacterized protein YeaO (DUF488 family)
MKVMLKRVYEAADATDGFRVLVDRLWPRGLTKQAAGADAWLPDIAPSHQLRRWYHARPSQWPEFRNRYIRELSGTEAMSALSQLHEMVHDQAKVTLLFASRNPEHNNASVLKQLLEGARKPPSSSGPARAVAGRDRARARARKLRSS